MYYYYSVTLHILQSPQWGEFRKKTPNVKTVLKIDGCQIFIHKIPLSPWTVAYLPRPAKISNMEKIKDACRKERSIFLKIEPAQGFIDEIPDSRLGIPILPQHTLFVDLTKSEEELMSGMHEKTRYNIRLAQKKGVVVEESENLEAFIQLLEKTEDRQGFYSHPSKYYRTLWETLHPVKMAYLLTALPYAAIMLFKYKNVLYYPYGGSDPEYKELMAPNLLHFEAMKLGKKLGCDVYDLWGSYKDTPTESDPWWGIYRFKKGFGGDEITFPPSVDVPLSPLYSLYPLMDKFRKLTK